MAAPLAESYLEGQLKNVNVPMSFFTGLAAHAMSNFAEIPAETHIRIMQYLLSQ